MKKRITIILSVALLLATLTACSLIPNKLSGTYTLEKSGILSNIVSAVGAMDSLNFGGDEVTVNSNNGTSWVGTYTLDDTTLTISPTDGGIGLSGTVSDDQKSITISKLTFTKE